MSANGRSSGRNRSRALTISGLAVLCLLTALTLALGYANKARCTGPDFDEQGRSEPAYQERAYGDVCYSDIQNLWIGRDIDRHVFPYVHGGIRADGTLYGGVVEYPVLTGVLIWVGALFAHTDAGFLAASALLMAPFGLAVAWWLGRLSGWRALLWALSPPLVWYAFHNWDLPVVACSVAAVFVVHRWTSVSLRRRATVAAVLLGAGFALKLYPALFVLPLALYVLTSGRGRLDVRGAVQVVGAAVATAVAVNVPFALAGFGGWLASFEFQSRRQVDISTNSVWYWGFRHWTDSEGFQSAMGVVSPLLMLVAFAIACGVGWLRYERTGSYPWVQVSAAMLCGFLLLHKVHSPQYTLWLLPMFVLVSVRWGWIAAYLVADAAMGISIFRWFYLNMTGEPSGIHDGFTAQALMIGVWGRAALLVGLFIAFLAARSTVDDVRSGTSSGAARALPDLVDRDVRTSTLRRP
ncbi:glycosyltransferase 87 family protein [Saccharopolyspora sp. K220]|uniref:glycosyltransferase family 87 protein n=1 Tax=Saccharopolyspora soli TaxID=2926618 RepID=UPI001F5AC658|nr:glycosyltransferase 87 family protein [Saccharopolyspora soli]MCI2418863.1 glycosyltransferase 87 family protein [Saccharopolyspora soli]